MEFRKKLLGAIGVSALVLGMAAGPAMAADTDSTEVSISVVCPALNDVTISGSGQFSPIDLNNGAPYTSSTADGDLEVEVNVGCYFEAWHVDAEITAFTDGGLLWFPGSWFSLEAEGDSGPEVTAQSAEFAPAWPGGGESENEIFGTTNIITSPPIETPWFDIPGVELDAIAPGVSSAWFTGHLDLQSPVLPAEYSADLTVTLTLDENPIVTWP